MENGAINNADFLNTDRLNTGEETIDANPREASRSEIHNENEADGNIGSGAIDNEEFSEDVVENNDGAGEDDKEEDDEDGQDESDDDENNDNGASGKSTNIKTEGDGTAIISESTIGLLLQIFGEKKGKSTFRCPNCKKVFDIENTGSVQCPYCKTEYQVSDDSLKINKFSTLLDDKEAKQFEKIIANIQNKSIDRDFEAAYNYCLQAQIIAPGEAITWKYFALTEFLYEVTKKKRKKTYEIIKNVKKHLSKARIYGMSDAEIEEKEVEMADILLNTQKTILGNIKASRKDINGHDKWLHEDLLAAIICLNSIEQCYTLNKDSKYLEECARELAKPYKWMVKKREDGSILNTPACGKINAVEKLKTLVSKIREHKPDFEQLEIAEERCIIKKAEYLNVHSTTKINN